ncbi:MAG: NTP transferase domain-containing protein [Phycisphaerae bacterium]|nr:NTP transferase domain-containing protein [Phycisphaerales bacterium]
MTELPCVAGILVGGKSSRFGRPKALEPLPSGKTVLAHVIEAARSVASDVVLLGTSGEIDATAFNCRLLPDPSGASGPIGGLSSLLAYAADRWGLLLACDLPLLQSELLVSMLKIVRADNSIDAVTFGTGLKKRPFYACCALYHPRILPQVLDAVNHRRFRLQAILQTVHTHVITPDESQMRMLQDMNTPEDKSRLLG